MLSCSPKNQSDHQKSKPCNAYHINLQDEKSDELLSASSISDTVIYVPLETNNKSIFSYPWLIGMNDSYIVLSDKERILAFQRNGKFITEIGKKGKGPGEFLKISGLLLKADTVFIASLGKKALLKYTVKGEYLGAVAEKHDAYYLKHLCKIPDSGYAWYDWMNGNIVYFDDNWKITDTLSVERNVSSRRQLRPSSASDDQYLIKSNGRVLFKDYKNDTIYEISSREKTPAIIFNLKEKLLPDNLQVENFDVGNVPDERIKPFQRINILETDSFVFVLQRSWIDTSQKPLFFVHNRSTKKTVQYTKPVIYDDIHGGMELPLFFYFDNTIISMVDYTDISGAYELATIPKEKQFWKQLLTNINENSNPILVIIKAK